MANDSPCIKEKQVSFAGVRWRYLFQEMLLIIVFSYLIFGAFSIMGSINPIVLRITAVLFSLVVGGFILSKPVIRPGWSLPVLFSVGVVLISTVFAIQTNSSLSETYLLAVSFFALFFFSELIRRGLPGELVIKSILIVGAVLMLWSWIPAVQWYLNWLANQPGQWFPDVTFRLPVPNMLAVLINAMTMLAIARFLFTKSLFPRVLLFLYSLSGLALLYLSSSRGGWVGTAAGMLCLGLLSFHYQRHRWVSIWQWLGSKKHLRVAIFLVAFFGMIVVAWLLYGQAAHSTHPPFFRARAYLWQPAWQAFLDHPLTGIGLGNYINYYFQVHSTPPNQIFSHAHNVYLEVLYSSGLLGLASLGWLLLAMLRELRQRFYQVEGVDRALFVGAAAALVSFLAHSFFDSLHFAPGLLLILMTALAAGLESGSFVAGRSSLQKWSGRGIQLLGILIVAYAWFYIWQISPVHRAVQAVHSGDPQTGAALMSEASRRAPHDPFVFDQLGLIYSIQIEQGDSSRLEDAIHAFNRAAELNPYWSIHHANLGSLYRSQGYLDEARQAFRYAAALAPDWYAYPLELAEIEEQHGDPHAAVAAYQQAIALWPDWAPVEYWQGSPLRSGVFANWINETPARHQTDIAVLERQLAADPTNYQNLYKLTAAYRDQGSWQQVEHLLQRRSLLPEPIAQLTLEMQWIEAELSAQSGAYAEAVQLGEDVLSRYREPGIYGPGSGRSNYWELFYRKPGIWLEVVPQSMGMEFPSRAQQIVEWKLAVP